jgi:[ribosomal protein S18]-alanine N-acetyltransferase
VPFQLRDFQLEDFDTLWRIDQRCFPPGISYSRQELKLYLRRPRAFVLLAASSQNLEGANGAGGQAAESVVGFIVAEAGVRGSGHIITIDVEPPARRAGVGSLLLRSAEERLQAAGCDSVLLETAVDNFSAISFYKRHGYSVTRTFPHYYSNGVDALVLVKKLEQGAGKVKA